MNVYLLSQHSLGVGHLSRTSLLAGEIAKIPGVSVVHISCGPSTGIILPKPGVSLVELPPLIVSGLSSTELVPTERGKTRQDVEKERVRVVEGLMEGRRPTMFITEFFPFSPHRLDGTVMPILRVIKERYPECAIVCSSRDIPVCQGEVLPAEKVASISSILNTYYDLLLVHSDPAVLSLIDIPKLRALKLSCPIVYTGYICERRSAMPQPAVTEGRRKIIVTVGGGRDGHHLIDCAIRVAVRKKEYLFDIVCGPFMEKSVVEKMNQSVARSANAHLHWYVRNLKETIAGYDLVICKGGYNTLMETIVRGRRCISIPRKGSYEQGKRARVFSAKGLLTTVAETRLTAKGLSRLIDEAFCGDHRSAVRINTEGLKQTTSIIWDWLSSRREGVPARPAPSRHAM
jgi:predicted glycosyltransferase